MRRLPLIQEPVLSTRRKTEEMDYFTDIFPTRPENLPQGVDCRTLAIKGHEVSIPAIGGEPTILVGQKFDVEWVDLKNPIPPSDDLRLQGFANGCARFAAGEGMQYSQGSVLFACTFGGGRERGRFGN